jgi:SHS2 domain-containing protein
MSVNVGYRVLPHTADTRIEAWAPARAACLEAAVRAFVSTFANVVGAEVTDSVEKWFAEPTDEDLLVAVLEQVIYLVEVSGVVPGTVDLADENDGRVAGSFGVVALEAVEICGPAPKAIALSDLQFEEGNDEWRCRVTIDV